MVMLQVGGMNRQAIGGANQKGTRTVGARHIRPLTRTRQAPTRASISSSSGIWYFANNVLQANEGASFVAHQYFIASQSGGLLGALSAPNAEVENPQKTPPSPDPTGDYTESDSDVDQITTRLRSEQRLPGKDGRRVEPSSVEYAVG